MISCSYLLITQDRNVVHSSSDSVSRLNLFIESKYSPPACPASSSASSSGFVGSVMVFLCFPSHNVMQLAQQNAAQLSSSPVSLSRMSISIQFGWVGPLAVLPHARQTIGGVSYRGLAKPLKTPAPQARRSDRVPVPRKRRSVYP